MLLVLNGHGDPLFTFTPADFLTLELRQVAPGRPRTIHGSVPEPDASLTVLAQV
jgi:hypothetical protein